MIGLRQPPSAESLRSALLQEPVGQHVRCLTCERRCLLDDGQSGWCHTRQNRAGVLYTLTYGAISSLSANPIEKKATLPLLSRIGGPHQRRLVVQLWLPLVPVPSDTSDEHASA